MQQQTNGFVHVDFEVAQLEFFDIRFRYSRLAFAQVVHIHSSVKAINDSLQCDEKSERSNDAL